MQNLSPTHSLRLITNIAPGYSAQGFNKPSFLSSSSAGVKSIVIMQLGAATYCQSGIKSVFNQYLRLVKTRPL